jgi:hypothetical protein
LAARIQVEPAEAWGLGERRSSTAARRSHLGSAQAAAEASSHKPLLVRTQGVEPLGCNAM